MKLSHISLAVVASITGNAHALTPAQVNDGTTAIVNAAGASAQRAAIAGLFLQNCDATTTDVYYSSFGAGTDFTGDAANGDSHRVFTCKFKDAANTDPEFAAFAGKQVAFYKRDAGGSAIGVFNVASAANTARLDLTLTSSCTKTANVYPALPQYLCTKQVTDAPVHLGFSDLEPAMFVGVNNPTTSAFNPAGVTVVPTYATIFGVAITNALRDAMQSAQGLTVGAIAADGSNRPSMPKSVMGSVLRGELQDPANGLGWQALGVANAATKVVNVCRRTPGSGTQATANLMFGDFPCSKNTALPARNADTTGVNSITGPFDDIANAPFYVYEGASTGNVTTCMTNANGASAYAVGHVSFENAEGTGWSFAKLDGVAPSRVNVETGRYGYIGESTAQYKDAVINPLPNSAGAFIKAFVGAAGLAKNLANLGVAQKGVTALPGAGAFNAAANQADSPLPGDLTRFYTRVSKGGNSCKPLSIVQ